MCLLEFRHLFRRTERASSRILYLKVTAKSQRKRMMLDVRFILLLLYTSFPSFPFVSFINNHLISILLSFDVPSPLPLFSSRILALTFHISHTTSAFKSTFVSPTKSQWKQISL